ncbi:MAG: hypothetical protein ACK5Z5_06280, partial [Neisseriaceae bacterium]
SYNQAATNPLGIVISKNSEFYLPTGRRIMPHKIATPGYLFGLSRILDNVSRGDNKTPSGLSSFIWDLNAGARSIFMLPKISDNLGHNKLIKKYSLVASKPASLDDQWAVFKELAERTNSNWRAEVLFFGNKWLEKLSEPEYARLVVYLSGKYRMAQDMWHNVQGWQATFSKIEYENRLSSYSPYTLDTARHLFNVATNGAPGFRPAIDDSSAPIAMIQRVYTSDYGLKNNHAPIVMEPSQFSSKVFSQPVYYSLNYATLPQFNPETFKGITNINLIKEVQSVVEVYQKAILNDSSNPNLPPSLLRVAQNVEFSFFHNDPSTYASIKNSETIPDEDKRFVSDRGDFSNFGAFLKGCVRISSKLKQK